MSDDLVKRLRAAAKHPMMDNNCKADVFDVADAADRIEELEAKLAKAVDVDLIEQAVDVELIEQAVSDVLYDGGSYRDAAEYVARTILAELKGQDDD